MAEAVHPVVDHSGVAESINESVNYTMYAVFREERSVASPGVGAAGAVLDRLEALAADQHLTVRGWYDVSGFRADADVLVWLHAPTPEALQAGYRAVLEGSGGRFAPVWSTIGVHRAAEFNRAHVPAFLAGEAPRGYLCVYPFVRGREWYLLPEEERRELLREHGAAARDYRDVLANTVASFALGDYEWLLGFEADELIRIVDLMRELRATGARRHVIEETPFFTGPLRPAEELLARALT
ncbi:hydrogen peroxide-dependent heme synthase [Leucobacter luti]|uniref:hydrogen peroxide-dependent heme synthase n=1 Tax=Leucobacter luti TaxID=340320 RepID=UPI003CFF68D8